ncbi:sigma 54-interacting transcriptional regulator [uncultured Desulfovibrio sp.]|uniref:sigma 54-interacting transcriptional regulator n=1 Tax=uncultured Desulfovibrio sp. TaxID=167968 RepID=UPI002615F5E7|nr:sigma 54-interacting transcriptional regulator [uncultured Desulfovibrio sp.]
MRQGNPTLYQSEVSGDSPALRAQVNLDAETAAIRIFKGADLSSIPHESAHIFVDDLRRVAADDGSMARESLRSDLEQAGMDATPFAGILSGEVDAERARAMLRDAREEQAITHIDQILAVAEDVGQPEMVSVCRRALAMYHFLSRRRKEARRILALDGRGGPALPLTDPRMLEMLVSLEKDGPPIPGYGLREIMSELEKGPSRLLRGVCLRLRAHFPETPASARGRLLRESCEELARTGNVREELLSVRMLVQALEEEGRPEDILAWKQREKTLLASWRSDRRSKEKPGEHAAFPVCGPCLNAFLRIRPVTRGSAIRHVVGTVQRELGAQRAILLRLYNDERMDYLEAVNVSLTEFEDASFHTIRRALLELLQSSGAGAVFFPLNDNRSAFLLDIDEQTRWLLYLDSELPGSLFSRIGQTEGSAFAAVLSSEFRAAWHLPGEGRRAGQAQDVTPYFGIDMDRVLEQATEALVSDAPLIIHGETGTGKEQMAHFIYTRGDYKGAFVPAQLSSLPEQLFESEMFGHEQGAFTGAHRRKMGFMELAHDGVLFLDEIADISPLIQVKLLRALQEKRFTRVGGVQQQFSNFRLISATNKDIWQEVREGRFREDLAYRLCVIPLELPPLRERPHDLEVLIRQLHTHFLRKYGKAEKPVRAEDMRRLLDYGWPGNIRELYSIMEQYVLFGCFRFRAAAEDRPAAPCASEAGECFADLPSMEDMQQRYIRMVLRRTGGKIYGPDGAAAILGMTKSTLYQKMKKYGISHRHDD